MQRVPTCLVRWQPCESLNTEIRTLDAARFNHITRLFHIAYVTTHVTLLLLGQLRLV